MQTNIRPTIVRMVGRIIRGSQRMEFDLLSSLQLSINHCCCIRASFWAPPPLKSPWVFSTRLALTTPSGLQVAFQHIPGCCMVLADSLLSLSLNSHCLSGAEAQPCCGGEARRLLFQGYSKLGDQPPEPICKLSGPSFPLGCPGASHSEKEQPWPGCRPTSCYL